MLVNPQPSTVVETKPTQRYGAPAEIKSLTGVRFAAAAWVLGLHLQDHAFRWCPALEVFRPFLSEGHFAVPFFFILSGFILSHVYFPSYNLSQHGRFIWLRFARLWPVHIATISALLIYLIVGAIARGYVAEPMYPLRALPQEIGMVRGWFERDLIWNPPAWSIHCEWFAYLFLFPVCYALLSTATNRAALTLAIATMLAANTLIPDETLPGWLGRIVFLFVAGSALSRLRTLMPRAPGRIFTTAGGILFITGSILNSGGFFYGAFAFLIFGLSYEQGLLSSFFSSRLLVYGGTISYSLYMTHGVGMKLGFEILKRLRLPPEFNGVIILVGMISLILVGAILTQRFVESPANRLFRNFRWRVSPANTPVKVGI